MYFLLDNTPAFHSNAIIITLILYEKTSEKSIFSITYLILFDGLSSEYLKYAIKKRYPCLEIPFFVELYLGTKSVNFFRKVKLRSNFSHLFNTLLHIRTSCIAYQRFRRMLVPSHTHKAPVLLHTQVWTRNLRPHRYVPK